MSSPYVFAALLAVLAAQCLQAAHDDDFAFEIADDFHQLDFDTSNVMFNNEIKATIGRTFHLIVAKDGFGKDIRSCEAKRHGGKKLPSWLLFDKTSCVFWGVPFAEDAGTIHVTVRGVGAEKMQDFAIKVVEADDVEKCTTSKEKTILELLVDKSLHAIKPKQRIIAINNVAKFLGLPYSAFTLKTQVGRDSSVILAGPGDAKSHKSKHESEIQVTVGCDGRLWTETASLVHQLKQQARDGTISKVLQLPLIGWRVKTEIITDQSARRKRQVEDYGSGDYDLEEYYDDYDEEYDEEGEDGDPPLRKKSSTSTTSTTTTPSSTHPHRHHHGEAVNTDILFELENRSNSETSPMTSSSTSTTTSTTTTTERPTTTTSTAATTTTTKTAIDDDYNYENYDDEDDNEDDPVEGITNPPQAKSTTNEPTITEMVTEEVVPQTETVPTTISTTSTVSTTITTTTTTTTTTTAAPTTLEEIINETVPETTSTEGTTETTTTLLTIPTVQVTNATTLFTTTTTTTTPLPTTTEDIVLTTEEKETTTPVKSTTLREIATTERTTTTREATSTTELDQKNYKPYIENRLQKMSVIAGKIFRFVIPLNTFKDMEDEYNLRLEFLDANEQPLTKTSWCQFNPARREVYGLPLEEDVSKWVYYVRAIDKDGDYEQDKLTIQVQQHKLERVVNHEFSLEIRIEKQQEFPHFVDWSLKVLRALGRIYNTNMSEITVRHINHTSEPVVFTWANDSIPTSYCPKSEIQTLYKMLTANDRGDPSKQLNIALSPELRVKKVVYRELGVCEQQPQTPVTPPMNFSPILRNPVDQVNATVGELLVFKVKDDTFYDPEDVDPRTLNISLLTGDRQVIPSTNWLQFDSKNREFYGVPRKVGRTEYQLVCVDSGGLPATDSLEVVVFPATKRNYNVEFSMTIEIPHETFINSASTQKKFVEKLRDLFGDQNTSHIHLNPFKQKMDSTIVTWFNKSLPIDKCPNEDISRLESVMNNMNDRSISGRVHSIMEPEFPISTIKVHLIGNCKRKDVPIVLPPPDQSPPTDESSPQSSSDEYLITFIVPAVIISLMLFFAAVAACVLYRRRRSGKMNVEEDGRQSYGNKGIPVIFQEELEEKPEPGTKTPVILKDEKPPLAPPEYSKSGSVKMPDDSEPYQPPPPFTRSQDNGRQSRPKPTPTYRKPPPYVPP